MKHQKLLAVTIVQDTLDELDETFHIGLSNPTNATILMQQA